MNPSSHASAIARRPVRGHRGRLVLVWLGVGSTGLLILLPLVAVFAHALRDGLSAYVGHLTTPESVHAIGLTLLAAGVAVPVSTAFGLAAAWTVGKFDFPGRRLLTSLIELPLSLSPIIFGVAYLFVFGMQGLLGPWLDAHGVSLAFNVTAIVVVTTMVTSPYVFREVLPLVLSQGTQEEQAAIMLGAGGWQTFLRVTLPNIRWALLYGVTLCFARSLGEFGAVSVVSGAVRGETNTITLHIELLANDRVATGAFAIATILTSIAIVTLLVKTWVERRESAET
jgi:sulfate/thiosulfate transport system permease protein